MELSYWQAILTGFLQGITELFPISSLGHSILVPAWIGGSWNTFLTNSTAGESPYLLMIIALHAASAITLLLIFWKRWLQLIKAFFRSLKSRSLETAEARIIWLVLVATVPVGVLGVLFEQQFQLLFSEPLAASIFLTLNGLILIVAEKSSKTKTLIDSDETLVHQISFKNALTIGVAQSAALFPGISRFGVTMGAGLNRGLSHSAASDFAFLLATPVILGAGVLKIPDLFNPEISHIIGPVIVGSIVAVFGTYISVKILVKWFKHHTLYPFAIYCLFVGLISAVKFL
ncbi:MAG: undecaprenyl-diphosphate phosphatase [Actinobacteria bacterium]|nr:undecaprenyl-diphosphate phosphatase [Actinomycetota bacterium]